MLSKLCPSSPRVHPAAAGCVGSLMDHRHRRQLHSLISHAGSKETGCLSYNDALKKKVFNVHLFSLTMF